MNDQFQCPVCGSKNILSSVATVYEPMDNNIVPITRDCIQCMNCHAGVIGATQTSAENMWARFGCCSVSRPARMEIEIYDADRLSK